MRSPQLKLLKSMPLAYGGELLKARKGRSQGRPLATKSSMHLVLRSSQAKGKWSFRRGENPRKIQRILKKFAQKYSVTLISVANVGNHLHVHIQLLYREGYKPFIRAISGAIAMAVTGRSRWNVEKAFSKLKFWDYRPFTRVIKGYRALLTIRDYLRINKWEGFGVSREMASKVIRRLSTA